MKELDPLDALERYYRSQDDLLAPERVITRQQGPLLLNGLKLAAPFAAGVAMALLLAGRPPAPSQGSAGFEPIAYQAELRQELLAVAPGPTTATAHPPRRHTMLLGSARTS